MYSDNYMQADMGIFLEFYGTVLNINNSLSLLSCWKLCASLPLLILIFFLQRRTIAHGSYEPTDEECQWESGGEDVEDEEKGDGDEANKDVSKLSVST